MVRDKTALLQPVQDELISLGAAATDIRPFAAGLEFAVFSASWEGRKVVVKTPWSRHIANANDPDQDARDLIRQEAELLGFARALGVAAPKVVLAHVDGALDLLVTELVANDGSIPSGEDLAALLADIHAAPAPKLALVGQPGPFNETVAERLGRRARVVERLGAVQLGLPSDRELAALIGADDLPVSLLHLDVRKENVLSSRGRITGLVDWTNALLGDPALELARISEYKSAPPGFFAAYAKRRAVRSTRACELIYRLDTAVMLALVFLSEAPDPARARPQLARVAELANSLRAER